MKTMVVGEYPRELSPERRTDYAEVVPFNHMHTLIPRNPGELL
jgi:hypothetical protein